MQINGENKQLPYHAMQIIENSSPPPAHGRRAPFGSRMGAKRLRAGTDSQAISTLNRPQVDSHHACAIPPGGRLLSAFWSVAGPATVGSVTQLNISIVTHAPDLVVLATALERLGRALRHAGQRGQLSGARLILVDNGPGSGWREPLQRVLDAVQIPARVDLLSGHGNVGYGAGHNLALGEGSGDFHLILNPDVLQEEDALSEGLAFLASHPEAGLVTPAAWGGDGQRQYLCKRYPTLLDLALRGFAPGWLRGWFRARLDRYELRDRTGDAVFWDPPIASGCFMLCRRAALDRVGGFRPEYFLYFEDFDLSLRLAAVARLAYVPAVRIVHLGGHAARKGVRHIGLFLRAAVVFFNRHGWRGW